MNDKLRREIKLLKALQGISYREIAVEYLEIKPNSFYNWLRGDYNFSNDTAKRLAEVINILKEG